MYILDVSFPVSWEIDVMETNLKIAIMIFHWAASERCLYISCPSCYLIWTEMHAMYSRTCNLELHILYLKILRDSDFHRFAVTVTPRCGFSYLCSPATERSSSTGTERSNHDSVFSRLWKIVPHSWLRRIYYLSCFLNSSLSFVKKTPQIHKKNCTLEKWSEGKLTDFSSVSLLLKTSTHILTLLITQVFRLLLFGSLLLIFVCELPIIWRKKHFF